MTSRALLRAKIDVLAPCALGAVLDEDVVRDLKARVVCGAANNQLATPADGAALAERAILYAPDYVVNAGGIINVAAEYLGWQAEEVGLRVDRIGTRLSEVLDHADRYGLAPHEAADAMARSILADTSGKPALAA
jgi:leucine dehydrogenase